MTRQRLTFVALLTLLAAFTSSALASSASAAQWTLDKNKSSLGFAVKTAQAEIAAKFETFTAQITLDPEDLGNASVNLEIDIASARSGNAQNDGAIASPTWLAVADFPKAVFASSAVRSTGGNAYEMDGNLTLRGIEKALTIPFTLDVNGSTAQARGKVDVVRTDFGIGQGPFASGDQIELSVKISFDFTASK